MKRIPFDLLISLSVLLLIAAGCGEQQPSAWARARKIADKIDHPSALAIDGENVFFVTGGTVASKNEGSNNVMRIPLAGGPPEILFRGGELIPDSQAIAFDSENVYFSAGGLRKVPKKGGEATLLTQAFMPSEMIVDKSAIYWLPFVGEGMPPAPLYRIDKSGGDPVTLTGPRSGANGLCDDETHVFWTERNGIYRIAKGGGAVETVHQSAEKPISGLRMDAVNFYFLEGDTAKRLFKMPRSGGRPTEIAKDVSRFWLAGNRIVFERFIASFRGAIFSVSVEGGGETELDRDGHLASLAAAGNRVIFSDVGSIYLIEN